MGAFADGRGTADNRPWHGSAALPLRTLRNGAHLQDLAFKARGPVTEERVNAVYNRLEQRFRAAGSWQRPIVTSEGWDVQRLGLNQRDIEWLVGLRWSLVGVATSLARRMRGWRRSVRGSESPCA